MNNDINIDILVCLMKVKTFSERLHMTVIQSHFLILLECYYDHIQINIFCIYFDGLFGHLRRGQ